MRVVLLSCALFGLFSYQSAMSAAFEDCVVQGESACDRGYDATRTSCSGYARSGCPESLGLDRQYECLETQYKMCVGEVDGQIMQCKNEANGKCQNRYLSGGSGNTTGDERGQEGGGRRKGTQYKEAGSNTDPDTKTDPTKTANPADQQNPNEGTAQTPEEIAVAEQTKSEELFVNSSRPFEQIQDEVNRCDNATNHAKICCQDPVKCVDEDSGFSLGNMQLITALAQAGSTLAGGGIQEQCARAAALGNFGAVANSAMAVTCQVQKGGCEDTCEPLKQEYDAIIASGCTGKAYVAGGEAALLCTEYRKGLRKISSNIRSCSGLAGQVAAMGLQAVSQAQQAQGSQICADASAAPTTTLAGGDIQTDCTDPANASNPFCKNCSDPAMASDPICQQILATSPPPTSTGNTYDSTGGAEYGAAGDGFDTGDDGTVAEQRVNFDPTTGVATKTSGVGRGGGGVPGGGGGAAPFGSGGNGSGAGTAKSRYKTDTLHGVSGGGGYSVSGMGFQSSGGGSRSYGSRDYTAKKRMKKFNLKDFVPNVHKPLLDRAPAGQIARDIGSKNSKNIFQRVSDLFYRHCRTGDFYDCQKIQKQKIIMPVVAGSLPASKGRRPASVAMMGTNKRSCVNSYKKRYCVKKYKNASCYQKAELYCK